MKLYFFTKVVFIFFCCIILVIIYHHNLESINNFLQLKRITRFVVNKDLKERRIERRLHNVSNSNNKKNDRIVLSLVVCGSRFNQSLNLIKSAFVFTTTPIYFIIITEDDLLPMFSKKLIEWKSLNKIHFDYELHKINFPEKHRDDWTNKNFFFKCAAQRLFLPQMVPHVDALIYIDTDVLFLGPIDNLWKYFAKFNSKQIAGVAMETDNPNISWYTRFSQIPFYGYGLNTGVMMMNLTRMRTFHWVDYLDPILQNWKRVVSPFADQDIVNIIFHFHDKAVYVIPCQYNYRPDQCMYGDSCINATVSGVYVIHGSRSSFHSKMEPTFEAVYRSFNEYELHLDPKKTLLVKLKQYLDEIPASSCSNLKNSFTKVPTETLNKIYR